MCWEAALTRFCKLQRWISASAAGVCNVRINGTVAITIDSRRNIGLLLVLLV